MGEKSRYYKPACVIYRKRGDNVRPLRFQLYKSDGTYPDLSGATVMLYVGREKEVINQGAEKDFVTNELIINSAMTIDNAVNALVSYVPTSIQMNEAGRFVAEIEVQNGGSKETYPEMGYIVLIIERDIL